MGRLYLYVMSRYGVWRRGGVVYSSRYDIARRVYHLQYTRYDCMGCHMHGRHNMGRGRDHNLGRDTVSDGRYECAGTCHLIRDMDRYHTYHPSSSTVHPLVFAWYALWDYIHNGTRISQYGSTHTSPIP